MGNYRRLRAAAARQNFTTTRSNCRLKNVKITVKTVIMELRVMSPEFSLSSLHMELLPVGCLRRNNSFTLLPPSVVTKLSNQSLCYYSGLPTNLQCSAFRLQTHGTAEDGNKPRARLMAFTTDLLN